MACLLYCITGEPGRSIPLPAGVGSSPMQRSELPGLCVFWSEIADPETLLQPAEALKKSTQEFQQWLRGVVLLTTPLPFSFPVFVDNPEAIAVLINQHRSRYVDALAQVADVVQYEITASWATDESADLATPVSGKEYLKRRQENQARVAGVENKLKAVTGDTVRQWHSRQEKRTHRWFALVPRAERERFVASLRTAGTSEGVRLRLSGPWPPAGFFTNLHEDME